MDLYKILKNLNIKYTEVEHEAVFTAAAAQKIKDMIKGTGCKNLFLTDKKGSYFLVILQDDKRADIKSISKLVNTSHLTFAEEEDLNTILKLKKGSVTPFGIINDTDNKVMMIIDEDLKEKNVLFHPNINTKTISLKFDDLLKFIEYEEHKYVLCKI